MKLFKRILSVCLLAVLLLFVMKEPSKAQTKTRETPYGTLTGTLNGYGSWVRKYGFKGTTTCSQNRNLFVAVEVRNNSNGKFENSKSNKKNSTRSVSISVSGNDKKSRKSGYGTHELRGPSSYVIYTFETQG